MNKTTTFYKFIGTEEDAKKYPDPEPILGREYSEDYFGKIVNDPDFMPDGFSRHWQAITKSEPIPANDVLTKMDRIEIWKLWENSHLPLGAIENYVAFGTWPE